MYLALLMLGNLGCIKHHSFGLGLTLGNIFLGASQLSKVNFGKILAMMLWPVGIQGDTDRHIAIAY